MRIRNIVWEMIEALAQWVQQWKKQNGIVIIGGKVKRSLGTFVQSDVKMADPSENDYRSAVRPLAFCFFDNLVPQRAEVMLQFRKSFAYLELGKCLQNVQKGIGAIGSASNMDKDGK